MAASTPSMCLRSDSDCVHSHTRSQASSRSRLGPLHGQGILVAVSRTSRRNGEVRHRRRRRPCRGPSRRQATRTPPCPRSPRASSPRRRSCCATSRASATWRRCSSCSRTSAWTSSGATTTSWRSAPTSVDPTSRWTASWPSAIRASFLLAGPLLARFGRADMPPPGGDVIGRRRLDPHLDAFRALGAEVEPRPQLVPARPRPTGCAPATSSWTSRRSWPPRTR